MLWEGSATPGSGVILVALQLVLFESPDRGFPQRVVVSNGATAGASLRPALLVSAKYSWRAHAGPGAGVVAGQRRALAADKIDIS